MRRSPLVLVLAAAVLASLGAVPAAGDPAGKTTLEETIRLRSGSGFRTLTRGPGEAHVVRRSALGKLQPGRTGRRRSLLFFAQFTDPQLADEMSPARVELLDPAGGPISAAWRPQEAMGAYVLDQQVRNVNRNRTSPVPQGNGRRRSLEFAITTGDLPDNMQFNELSWFLRVMRGGRVDPFSGQSASSCGADAQTTARLNADVAARRYTGVQDFDDWPGRPADRYEGFWDPDAPRTAGLYPRWPRYPGLMDAAQRAFTAEGLRVPWFTSRGNHDGLVQGNAAASEALFRSIATGCLKIFPSAAFDPDTLRGKTEAEIFAAVTQPGFIQQLLAGGETVPPDARRRLLSKVEYKALHGGGTAHGFGFVSPAQQRASRGTASYYDFSPRPGFRFVALDTVAEGGGADGNLDDPQYEWLKKVLDENSSVEVTSTGRIVRDGDPDRYIVVFSHHTLGTLDNPTPDEEAGCRDPQQPGCDGDPRDSRPIHLGKTGSEPLEQLLLRYPNVIAFVNGHTHRNAVAGSGRRDGLGGFWQINTASHVDYPQHSRLIEVMDNRDGTLSLFGTVLETAAPIVAPRAGTAGSQFTPASMASLSRILAANDPQYRDVTDGGGLGTRADRNVELPLRDPARLWAPRGTACAAGEPRADAAC